MAARVTCNLTVIRSSDIERSVLFYEALGLTLVPHLHGSGPLHYAFEERSHTFEIYPIRDALPTTSARIGFSVDALEETIAAILEVGGELIVSPQDSPWGRRAVIRDPDGHRVELTLPA